MKVKDLNCKYDDKGYVFNHSLVAYNKETKTEDKLISLLNDNSMQICCTLKGQYINGIGVELKGECLLVGTRDMCSEIEDGDRTISNEMMEYIYNGNLEDATLMEVVDNYYNEAIVTNFSVIAMWCNPYCAKSNREAKEILIEAKRLSAKYNLQLKIVQNNSLFY